MIVDMGVEGSSDGWYGPPQNSAVLGTVMLKQGRAMVVRFVGVLALFNLAWFLVTLPLSEVEPAVVALGMLAFYGQGTLFAVGLWIAYGLAPVPAARLSWRTFVGIALGQPLIVIVVGLLAALVHVGAAVYLLASVCGGALVVLCLHRDTGYWAQQSAVAMLVFTTIWAAVPITILLGWDIRILHVGAFGGGSSSAFHPFVTALWQIPMAGLVASWLIRSSEWAERAGAG
jgi:hypothetical protein